VIRPNKKGPLQKRKLSFLTDFWGLVGHTSSDDAGVALIDRLGGDGQRAERVLPQLAGSRRRLRPVVAIAAAAVGEPGANGFVCGLEASLEKLPPQIKRGNQSGWRRETF